MSARSPHRAFGRALLAATVGALVAGACKNAGEDRILGISQTGVVRGIVYFDLNGSGTADAADRGIQGVIVRLRARGTTDTTAQGVTDAQGLFRIAGVPVGMYRVLVDTGRFGDSISIVVQDSVEVTVPPADSVVLEAGASFPKLSVLETRALPAGRKVFLEGVALTDFDNFGDTTLHVVDTSGFIRATRVLRTAVFAGDSVRVLGVTASRDGQPVLGNASVITLGVGALAPAPVLTTAIAATADGGDLDAALVRILNVGVIDSVTVLGDHRLTVDDGSGALTVVIDPLVTVTPRPVPGDTIDVVGALVPMAGGGVWVLKPRRNADVLIR